MSSLYNNYKEVSVQDLKNFLDRKVSGDLRDGYVGLFEAEYGKDLVKQRVFLEWAKLLCNRDNGHGVTRGDAVKVFGLIKEA